MRSEPNKRRAVAVFVGNHILDHFDEALVELGGPCPLFEAVVAHFPTAETMFFAIGAQEFRMIVGQSAEASIETDFLPAPIATVPVHLTKHLVGQ